jgi:hypothetical protein
MEVGTLGLARAKPADGVDTRTMTVIAPTSILLPRAVIARSV